MGGVNSVPDKFYEDSGNMRAIEGLDGSPFIPSLTGKLDIYAHGRQTGLSGKENLRRPENHMVSRCAHKPPQTTHWQRVEPE